MAPPLKKSGGGGSGSSSSKTILPNKERGLFTKLIQEYESKKYSMGIKTADQILKKFPDHGETLCMKGLLLASTNKQQEGLDLAKKGLLCDLHSFISWHALGILNRIVKNYNESIKCYAQALKIEGGTNINLVRESAYLYIQLRDWPKVVEHRLTLVRMQPHLRMNWIGLAVALHLGGGLAETLRVLEQFESVHRDVPSRSFEQSEVYLYHAQILSEAGRHQDAIDYLTSKRADQVLDAKSSDLLQSQSHLALGRNEEARGLVEGLLKQNEEEKKYINLWLKAKGVPAVKDGFDHQRAAEELNHLQTLFPTSRAVKRMSLTYATGDDFRDQASKYVINALQKGIPSIFNDTRALYIDDEKRKQIEQIVENASAEWNSTSVRQPTSYLWALYFLAQHYAHLGHHARALEHIHSAITHTPTLPELHMTRARIYKKAGALQWASRAMEDARLLDGQDRSLNCKAAKYLLRIGDIEGASAKAGLFTKPDVPDPVADLLEMQATWYLIEEAQAWRANGNIAMALKRCVQIDQIYTDIWDDQLDFHSYTTRKFTLRAYVDMIRFEDGLHRHHAFVKAAKMAIDILLSLHDTPSLTQSAAQNGSAHGVSAEEQKKEAKKQKKQKGRAAEEAAKKAAAEKSKTAEDDEAINTPKDDDPDGKKALAAVKPLVEAERFLSKLQRQCPSYVETWLLTYEVALRGRDWLTAVKALARAHSIQPKDYNLHVALLELRCALPKLEDGPEPIGESIAVILDPIVPSKENLEAYRADFLQKNAQSAEAQLAGARSLAILRKGEKQDEAGKRERNAFLVEFAKKVEEGVIQATLPILQSSYALVQQDKEASEMFAKSCRTAYPYADLFKTHTQKEQEAVERENERRSWDYAPAEEGASTTKANGP